MSENNKKKVLRLDDFGASARLYEKHVSGALAPLNFFPFFDARLFGSWAPFRELKANEIEATSDALRQRGISMVFCVTATFFDGNQWKPISDAYPAQVEVIREAINNRVFVLANHGLTHCAEEDARSTGHHLWGNRALHREFTSKRSTKHLKNSLERSQAIIEKAFGRLPSLLVPAGHAISSTAAQFCADVGITHIAVGSLQKTIDAGPLTLLSRDEFDVYHTRDFVLDFEGCVNKLCSDQHAAEIPWK